MQNNKQDNNSFEELAAAINTLTERSSEFDLFLLFASLDKKELQTELMYYENYQCYKCCKVISECMNKLN